MAKQHAGQMKQRAYWGKGLVMAGLLAMTADLSVLSRPLWDLVERFRDGLLGVIPAVGTCVLNATHALAFHQVDTLWLTSHILVLSSAMTCVIAGMALLQRKAKRTFILELDLMPEFQDRETINNGSR
jgi:hypothetical protein